MWVIGNGESRKTIDINKLSGLCIGCDAIARDYSVDYLVCVDRHMVDEVIRSNLNINIRVYTRSEWYEKYSKFLHVRELPELPYQGTIRADDTLHWGSGPYAVLLGALKTECDVVNLIGFDLYSKDNKINNIYKDAQNYDSSNSEAVDPAYWIHQLKIVFDYFPNIQFVIYQDDNWKVPDLWFGPNVTLDRISNIS